MSEIAEPIVVTPGKELETPEFFKKDIERISGEVFDKKIVNVPSGTKLYKHSISSKGLLIFCGRSQPFALSTIPGPNTIQLQNFNARDDKVIAMYYSDVSGAYFNQVALISSSPSKVTFNNDGTVTLTSILGTGDSSGLSDTVTEL